MMEAHLATMYSRSAVEVACHKHAWKRGPVSGVKGAGGGMRAHTMAILEPSVELQLHDEVLVDGHEVGGEGFAAVLGIRRGTTRIGEHKQAHEKEGGTRTVQSWRHAAGVFGAPRRPGQGPWQRPCIARRARSIGVARAGTDCRRDLTPLRAAIALAASDLQVLCIGPSWLVLCLFR